jgi:hypothetical protein
MKKRYALIGSLIAALALQFACPLAAEPNDYVVSAGRIGGALLASDGTASGAFTGDLLALTAIHGTSGIGVEFSPFSCRLLSSGDEPSVTLVNCTIFHRTFAVNDTSFCGPFVACNLIDLTGNGPSFRGGLRFSWRTPWTFKGEDLAPGSIVKPLFTRLDVETGVLVRDTPSFYFAVTTDTSVFAVIAAVLCMGTATDKADTVRPGASDAIPADGNDNPLIIGPDHP